MRRYVRFSIILLVLQFPPRFYIFIFRSFIPTAFMVVCVCVCGALAAVADGGEHVRRTLFILCVQLNISHGDVHTMDAEHYYNVALSQCATHRHTRYRLQWRVANASDGHMLIHFSFIFFVEQFELFCRWIPARSSAIAKCTL